MKANPVFSALLCVAAIAFALPASAAPPEPTKAVLLVSHDTRNEAITKALEVEVDSYAMAYAVVNLGKIHVAPLVVQTAAPAIVAPVARIVHGRITQMTRAPNA